MTRTLVEAARKSGAPHLVFISVVGTDRIPVVGVGRIALPTSAPSATPRMPSQPPGYPGRRCGPPSSTTSFSSWERRWRIAALAVCRGIPISACRGRRGGDPACVARSGRACRAGARPRRPARLPDVGSRSQLPARCPSPPAPPAPLNSRRDGASGSRRGGLVAPGNATAPRGVQDVGRVPDGRTDRRRAARARRRSAGGTGAHCQPSGRAVRLGAGGFSPAGIDRKDGYSSRMSSHRRGRGTPTS